jgi:hypothetical protein
MLERIGSTLSLYGRYDLLFDDSSRVQECLRIVYDDILSLLVQAKKLFEKSGKESKIVGYIPHLI